MKKTIGIVLVVMLCAALFVSCAKKAEPLELDATEEAKYLDFSYPSSWRRVVFNWRESFAGEPESTHINYYVSENDDDGHLSFFETEIYFPQTDVDRNLDEYWESYSRTVDVVSSEKTFIHDIPAIKAELKFSTDGDGNKSDAQALFFLIGDTMHEFLILIGQSGLPEPATTFPYIIDSIDFEVVRG